MCALILIFLFILSYDYWLLFVHQTSALFNPQYTSYVPLLRAVAHEDRNGIFMILPGNRPVMELPRSTTLNQTDCWVNMMTDLLINSVQAGTVFVAGQECLLNVMSRFPQACFSEKELGATCWYTEKNDIRKIAEINTTLVDGKLGNCFAVNDWSKILVHEFANPLVHPRLHLYPEDSREWLEEHNRQPNGNMKLTATCQGPWLTARRLSSDDRVMGLFLRLLHTKRQNQNILEQIQTLNCSSRSFIITLFGPLLCTIILSLSARQTYIHDHAKGLRLELYKQDPIVKTAIHEILASENNVIKSALRKVQEDHCQVPSARNPNNTAKGYYGMPCFYAYTARLVSKETSCGGDTGFSTNLEHELNVLFEKNGNEWIVPPGLL
ncbi:hypothetical protein B0H17DRAFT_1129406 [Mycena rosella]|uniref:Uncharacterized protein n=1 Tax=Mycena rosella TaxID=1033263 RepID=A0AAD7DTI3_MYCRO|nr:hypothetical protein B0H17DRAFT_1129406 [Mycena rosella]